MSGVLIKMFSDHQPYFILLNNVQTMDSPPVYVIIAKQDKESIQTFYNKILISKELTSLNNNQDLNPNITYNENCVRQEGVASPISFTVYLDELLVRLEKTNVGCYIGHEWYGGICYVDDMELQFPSIKGLQKLVSTCTEFGRDVEEMPRIYLEVQALSWVRVKFLGLLINFDLNEDIEIMLKQRDFIGRVNSLLYSFEYTTSRVLTFTA